MKKLTIETNHGCVILGDVTVEERTVKDGCREYRRFTASGTVLGGGQTSRLFHCTSTRKYPVGEPMQYEYWREAVCVDTQADEWRTSTVSCG